MNSEGTQPPQSPKGEPSPTAEVLDALALPTQAAEIAEISTSTPGAQVPSSGRRQAFAQIKRELSETDLGSPGVQKLLLELLEGADADCEVLRGYQDRFHAADKRAGILEERLKSSKAVEVGFAVGLTLGGACVGLAPTFWDASPLNGGLVLVLGVLLVTGSSVMRIVKG